METETIKKFRDFYSARTKFSKSAISLQKSVSVVKALFAEDADLANDFKNMVGPHKCIEALAPYITE